MVKLGDIIEIMIDYPDCAGVKTGDILEVVDVRKTVFTAQDCYKCVWQLSLRNENLHFEVVPTIPVPAPRTFANPFLELANQSVKDLVPITPPYTGRFIPIIYIPSSGYNQPKCECGAEKTYGIGTRFHSDWCPRYEPQTK